MLVIAVIGYFAGRMVPPAPRQGPPVDLDFNMFRASWRLIYATMHIKKLFLAIMSISFFLDDRDRAHHHLPAAGEERLHREPASGEHVLAIFSIGVAVGSVGDQPLLQGHVSARYGPISVLMMGAFVWFFEYVSGGWVQAPPGTLYTVSEFVRQPHSWRVLFALFGIAVFGGMFVVPLYAFMTTTVPKDETARTVAANNVVNSGAMVFGALVILGATGAAASPITMPCWWSA